MGVGWGEGGERGDGVLSLSSERARFGCLCRLDLGMLFGCLGRLGRGLSVLFGDGTACLWRLKWYCSSLGAALFGRLCRLEGAQLVSLGFGAALFGCRCLCRFEMTLWLHSTFGGETLFGCLCGLQRSLVVVVCFAWGQKLVILSLSINLQTEVILIFVVWDGAV